MKYIRAIYYINCYWITY